jgi:ADP-ribose pyrophosphatase YjhB (NUDIX family)
LEKGRDSIGVGVGAIVADRGRVLLLKRRKEPEVGCWGI